MQTIEKEINTEEIPQLIDWYPDPEDELFVYDEVSGCVIVDYSTEFGLMEATKLPIFDIKKTHYMTQMPDIVWHINYFLKFFDLEKELYVSTMSVKFIVDSHPQLTVKAFQKFVLQRIVTDSFITKIKKMRDYLYTIDVDNQTSIKYSNTPKITNAQAKQIIAASFAFRCVIPICLHFANNNSNIVEKKDYIPAFDKIYMKIIDKIEKDDTPFFESLSRFIAHRCNREYNANRGTWSQKNQLYGIVKELQIEEIIHEVVCIKSIHKLDYTQSCVSFIDSILNKYSYNFRVENFKSKPYEIDNDESGDDSDDRLSHAEQLEMSIYWNDESNGIVSEANMIWVMDKLSKKYPIDIPEEEYWFYYNNIKFNEITYMLMNCFFAKEFDSTYAIGTLSKEDQIWLVLWMKKWLQGKGLNIISQFCTAEVFGKFKDNIIKNQKFKEMITATDSWKEIIVPKYKYVQSLYGSLDPIIKYFSTLVHSEFVILDYDEELNGLRCNDVDMAQLVDEIRMFLIII